MRVSNFSFILVVLMFACTKKQGKHEPPAVTTVQRNYDTIFPQSYFPVYPKSTWVYTDQNNNQVIVKSDSIYKLDYYSQYPFQSDTFYVPFYENTAVWKYHMHNGGFVTNQSVYPFVAIVSETTTIGSSWPVHKGTNDEICRKVIARDTSIVLASGTYSPVIITEDYYCQGPPYYIWTTRRFFAKNVGIIKEQTYNAADSSIITTRSLLSYTIGH